MEKMRWILIVAAVVLTFQWGVYRSQLTWQIPCQPPDQEIRLHRTDLPGFGPVTLADPEGIVVVENHSEEQRSVTVVDDLGRGWRISAKGWSFQWGMTNSLGAWIEGRNLLTGRTEAFYLGSNVEQFGVCSRTLREGLFVDAMGNKGASYREDSAETADKTVPVSAEKKRRSAVNRNDKLCGSVVHCKLHFYLLALCVEEIETPVTT